MKKVLLLFTVLIFVLASCTYRTCPTYAKNDKKEKSKLEVQKDRI